jgi:cytoskeletal protein CcmA (bactofilin family)
MKMNNWLAFTLVLLVSTAPVFGLTVKSSDDVDIKVDEVIDDDLFAFGQTVSIKGKVNGDVCVLSQTVDITGEISGTVICVASNVKINASDVASIWAGAGTVEISGNIRNNIVVFGGNLYTEDETDVGNDILFYGGNARIDGDVKGSLKGSMGKLIIKGKFSRVDIEADAILIKSGTLISGDLVMGGDPEPVIEEGAEILGQTTYKRDEEEGLEEEAVFAIAPIIAFFIALFKIVVFITKIIVGIVVIALSRTYVRRIVDTMYSKPWPCLGWGFVGLIVIPAAVIILLAILIGYPFAIVGIYFYTIMFYMASIFAGMVIGEKIIRLFKKEGDISLYLSFIIGMVILLILGFIPVIGFIVKIIVLVSGSGMFLLGSWNLIKEIRAKKLI